MRRRRSFRARLARDAWMHAADDGESLLLVVTQAHAHAGDCQTVARFRAHAPAEAAEAEAQGWRALVIAASAWLVERCREERRGDEKKT